MATGTVKAYHADHGYGTIAPDGGGPELTVYFDSIVADADGGRLLTEGQRVEYDETEQELRPVAERVRALG
ncbi:cold-shock protein [Kitasatospora sp. NPDC054939]